MIHKLYRVTAGKLLLSEKENIIFLENLKGMTRGSALYALWVLRPRKGTCPLDPLILISNLYKIMSSINNLNNGFKG
jgi:hypothetical protein